MTATYTRLRPGEVARTIQVSPSVLFDLDARDRIIGAETIGESTDWPGALATLAMSGRLAIPERGDLWP